MKKAYPVKLLCRLMGVSRGGFYEVVYCERTPELRDIPETEVRDDDP